MNYKFTLTTKSMLLTGSGEGGVLIDADVVFHRTGFPFIPARRIKGMLKESMEEVLEMLGVPDADIRVQLQALFGSSGKQVQSGKLRFDNLYIEDWELVSRHLPENPPASLEPTYIRTFYTTEIQQTAIGKDGIAKDRSLRNYRVIKPDFTFEGVISVHPDLTDQELEYLQKAVTNLRHAGTRRNRGFGRIRCGIEAISTSTTATSTPTVAAGTIDQIAVEIKTVSPVVLAQQLGEQNTVVTRKYMTGNRLRGLLAGAYIRRHQHLDRTNAHQDADFRAIFLSGQLQFGNLFFEGTAPIPRSIQAPKINPDPKRVVYAFYTDDKDPDAGLKSPLEIGPQLKAIDKLGKVDEAGDVYELEPSTTFFFHNSRENRAAGRSTENDTEGGIFYYEALNEGQSFVGEISGSPAILQKLIDALPAHFSARLGRSKSAQYGSVEVALAGKTSAAGGPRSLSPGYYQLVLKSPLVILNDFGHAAPEVKLLERLLNDIMQPNGTATPVLAIEKVAAGFTTLEQYNTSWAAKSGKIPAFKEGSAFLLHLKTSVNLPEPLSYLGAWNERGFGKVQLSLVDARMRDARLFDQSSAALQNAPAAAIPDIPLLKDIDTAYQRQLNATRVKSMAIVEADKVNGKLNNHLISRLERLFRNSRSAAEIQTWMDEAKDKPAGDALQKVDLIENNRFQLNPLANQENHQLFTLLAENFDWQKMFWIAFFQTLRKINKTNDVPA